MPLRETVAHGKQWKSVNPGLGLNYQKTNKNPKGRLYTKRGVKGELPNTLQTAHLLI